MTDAAVLFLKKIEILRKRWRAGKISLRHSIWTQRFLPRRERFVEFPPSIFRDGPPCT
jgi:hypothetical protein